MVKTFLLAFCALSLWGQCTEADNTQCTSPLTSSLLPVPGSSPSINAHYGFSYCGSGCVDSGAETGDYYAPASIDSVSASKNAPVIVTVHGGGGTTGDKSSGVWNSGIVGYVALAEQLGAIVYTFDYTLNDGNSNLTNEQLQEIGCAMHWLAYHVGNDYPGNPRNMAWISASYGGYFANLMASSAFDAAYTPSCDATLQNTPVPPFTMRYEMAPVYSFGVTGASGDAQYNLSYSTSAFTQATNCALACNTRSAGNCCTTSGTGQSATCHNNNANPATNACATVTVAGQGWAHWSPNTWIGGTDPRTYIFQGATDLTTGWCTTSNCSAGTRFWQGQYETSDYAALGKQVIFGIIPQSSNCYGPSGPGDGSDGGHSVDWLCYGWPTGTTNSTGFWPLRNSIAYNEAINALRNDAPSSAGGISGGVM